MMREILLRAASAVALTAGISSAAFATGTVINGGGATLPQPTYTAEFKTYTTTYPTVSFTYAGVGSGAGQTAFLNNDATQFSLVKGTPVHFAASDAFLSSSQVTSYNTGAVAAYSGPLIQLPFLGTPVTIAFNKIGQTALNLNDNQLCSLFSGKATNLKAVGAGNSTTPVKIVYRADGSGTSFLLTQHLAAVCNSTNSKITFTATTKFATLFPNATPPANFIGGNGSGGVATALLGNANAIGYLSPDYTSVATKSISKTTLLVANLQNATDKKYYSPNTTNTSLGLKNPGAGSVNLTAPSTKTAAASALNWVPAIPVTKAGYPIVGYTTVEFSSCYSNANISTALKSFISLHLFNAAYQTTQYNNGFVPVAASIATAANNTFSLNSNGWNLNINNPAICKGKKGR
jgi:phosphate transport system substrate-binding protein